LAVEGEPAEMEVELGARLGGEAEVDLEAMVAEIAAGVDVGRAAEPAQEAGGEGRGRLGAGGAGEREEAGERGDPSAEDEPAGQAVVADQEPLLCGLAGGGRRGRPPSAGSISHLRMPADVYAGGPPGVTARPARGARRSQGWARLLGLLLP